MTEIEDDFVKAIIMLAVLARDLILSSPRTVPLLDYRSFPDPRIEISDRLPLTIVDYLSEFYQHHFLLHLSQHPWSKAHRESVITSRTPHHGLSHHHHHCRRHCEMTREVTTSAPSCGLLGSVFLHKTIFRRFRDFIS